MGCKPLDKPKQKHKKGLWSPDEDQKLRSYIMKNGHGCWSSIPTNAGLQRNGKSCRLRWINYLRPGLKRGAFTLQEEETILTLHQLLGNKWSKIAHHLPGRTDNEIKNYWHSYLKKRMLKMDQTEAEGKNESMDEGISSLESTPRNSSSESLETMEVSLMDTDQSKQQKCNLPKILFADWLSLDQFHGQNLESSCSADDIKYTSYDNNNENSLDRLVHGLLHNEGALSNEMHPKSDAISVDDILEFPFKFEDHISGNGLTDDYFTGEFNMSYDDLYI